MQYAGHGFSSRQKAGMMKQGVICFRTCYNLMLIPAAFVRSLAISVLDTTEGDVNEKCVALTKALDSWMLLQVVNTIGKHSIF